MENKFLFVGGNPLGHKEAFSEKTHSGKILRGLVKEFGFVAGYFDLWKNPKDEKRGIVSDEAAFIIHDYACSGYTIIALGRYVALKLLRQTYIHFYYLPHPARHSKQLRIYFSNLKSTGQIGNLIFKKGQQKKRQRK